jgi:hypothetical protein
MSSQFNSDNFSIFLPQYLTEDMKDVLKNELGQFTSGGIARSLFTSQLASTDSVYQGDGLNGLLVVNLPDTRIAQSKSLVISNTCDVDPSNKRLFPSMIAYCPIFSLEKYRSMLESNGVYDSMRIEQHLDDIRKQFVTQIFYLPPSGSDGEGLVFLDRVCHCASENIDRSKLKDMRLFTLSQFGHYLFLFKLSIHFTRMNDGVVRGKSETIQ